MNDSVTRYVITHLGRHGRTLIGPSQGRNTYATAAEAQAQLDAILKANTPERIAELWGEPLQVRPCQCWPGHFDPKRVWFD